LANGDERGLRQFLIDVVGRPVLLGLWLLFLWGTLYGLALLYAAVVEGPVATVRRALSEDPVVGAVNLALCGIAVLIWVAAGTVFWRRRKSQERPESQRRHVEPPRVSP
jgi:hypothetical protein